MGRQCREGNRGKINTKDIRKDHMETYTSPSQELTPQYNNRFQHDNLGEHLTSQCQYHWKEHNQKGYTMLVYCKDNIYVQRISSHHFPEMSEIVQHIKQYCRQSYPTASWPFGYDQVKILENISVQMNQFLLMVSGKEF